MKIKVTAIKVGPTNTHIEVLGLGLSGKLYLVNSEAKNEGLIDDNGELLKKKTVELDFPIEKLFDQ